MASEWRADTIKDRLGTGAPSLPNGANWDGDIIGDDIQVDTIVNKAGTGAPDLPYGQTSINDQPLSYDFASDADVTFTNIQNRHETVYITDSGSVLTGTTVINLDTVPFDKKMMANGTAQTITVQVVGGAGANVDIPAGGSALLESDGTDVISYREFLDEGLLGAPDTGFSSTGARIYPDGTIIGKCSDGSRYEKNTNGSVRIVTSYVMAYLSGTQLFYNATLPCTLSSASFTLSHAIVLDTGNISAADISDCEFFTTAKTTSSVSVRYVSKSSIFVSGDLAGVDIIIEGEYK